MNKSSEAFDTARSEYIEGYVEKKEHIFPTLSLIAKEFKLSLSTLRKKAANEGWYKKRYNTLIGIIIFLSHIYSLVMTVPIHSPSE